jgi:hypothetical protein
VDKDTVLHKIEELHLIYENGYLSCPTWYIPLDEKNIIFVHNTLFQGKRKMKLTLNEVAALFLENGLLDLNK